MVVRGRDSYTNLPNKTLRALAWGVGAAYTHFLKTDDDCYVRMDNVFRSIKVRSAVRLHSALRSDRRADQSIGIIDRRANKIDR